MFIEINGIRYNIYSICSFVKRTEIINDNQNSITKYYIVYELNNTTGLLEEFKDEESLNAKYDILIEKFGI